MSKSHRRDDSRIVTPDNLAEANVLTNEAGELLYVAEVDGEKKLVPLPFPPDRATRRYVIGIRDGLPAWVPAEEMGL